MKQIRLTLIISMAAASVGCGGPIFKANFNGWTGSPAGNPPGQPTADRITVQNQSNPVVSGSALSFDPPGNHAYLFSSPVKTADSTKTLFWVGRLKSGDGPFVFLVSGHDSPGTPFLTNPLELKFTNNNVQLIGPPPNSTLLGSRSLVPNTEHRVFISLRLKTQTYRITIQQAGAPEIELTGPLNPLTVNWIKSRSRIVLSAAFLHHATSTDEYVMDDVIMREKN